MGNHKANDKDAFVVEDGSGKRVPKRKEFCVASTT
jgi:hypothetical protein